MATMDQQIKDLLLSELNLTEDWADQELQAQTQGTVLEPVLQAKEDIFFGLFSVVISKAWAVMLAAFGDLVPQLFIRYASGHWLDERALDHGLARDLGQKTRLLLDCTKAQGTPLVVELGTVFFISETRPRRYQAVALVEPADQDTTFTVEVEAICPLDVTTGEIWSASYNAPLGLVWDCETALANDSVTYNGPSPTSSGSDPETDEALRARILAKLASSSVNPGGVLYYTNLLLTVPGVAFATHDATDGATATMTFSIYGASGALGTPEQDAAQALINQEKMETDTANILLATAEVLGLIISYKNAPSEAALIVAVAAHFTTLGRGEDFYEAPLYAALFAQFGTTYPGLILQLNIGYMALPAGRYWVPSPTCQALP